MLVVFIWPSLHSNTSSLRDRSLLFMIFAYIHTTSLFAYIHKYVYMHMFVYILLFTIADVCLMVCSLIVWQSSFGNLFVSIKFSSLVFRFCPTTLGPPFPHFATVVVAVRPKKVRQIRQLDEVTMSSSLALLLLLALCRRPQCHPSLRQFHFQCLVQ